MSSQEELEALKKLIKIQNRMNWKISELYNILFDHFCEYDDFNFPLEESTFRGQYSLKKKGSKKHFQKYLDYICTLEEVQRFLNNNKIDL